MIRRVQKLVYYETTVEEILQNSLESRSRYFIRWFFPKIIIYNRTYVVLFNQLRW